MNLLQTKKPLEKAAESDIGQAIKAAARSSLESALQGQSGNGATAKSGLTPLQRSKPLGWAAKPVLMVAGGVAGMTAVSAVVSAVRRAQKEG